MVRADGAVRLVQSDLEIICAFLLRMVLAISEGVGVSWGGKMLYGKWGYPQPSRYWWVSHVASRIGGLGVLLLGSGLVLVVVS